MINHIKIEFRTALKFYTLDVINLYILIISLYITGASHFIRMN